MLTNKTCELKPYSTDAHVLSGKVHVLSFTGILWNVGQNTIVSDLKKKKKIPPICMLLLSYPAWDIWSYVFSLSYIHSPPHTNLK